jgi:hypothetical protein
VREPELTPDAGATRPPSEANVVGVSRRRKRRSSERSSQGSSSLAGNDRRPIAIAAVLACTVLGSVLAVGAVHVTVLLVVAPFAALAGTLAVRGGKFAGRALPGAAALALALALYSVIQALPIPMKVLRQLSPGAASVWTRTLSALGPVPGWASLSLDPGASLVEALKWFCYGAVFCAGAAVARTLSRSVVPWIVFASAVVVAMVTLTHRLIAAESLYGIYTPLARGASPVAPLVNPNNLAGYLNLGAFVGVGLLMDRPRKVPRWAIALAVGVVVGMSAVCGSRAGLASLALGMIGLIIGLRTLNLGGNRRLIWLPIAALTFGIALFALAVRVQLWQSMLNEGAQKLALNTWTEPVLADFPLFGIGRGAFETVFPAYRNDVGHHLYQFAENFVTQWCVEWGIPVGLGACAGFAYLLRPTSLQVRTEVLALCCSIGVAVLLLQNLLDLALEVPSVSLALFALLGSLSGYRKTKRANPGSRVSLRPTLVFAAAFTLLWASVAFAGIHDALDDRRVVSELAKMLRAGNSQVKGVLQKELVAALRRHPADPYFPLIAATLNRGEKSAELSFISRAIERDPMAGRPYLLLAEALARRHAKYQALAAGRLAVERGYELIGPVTAIALGLTHQLDELSAVVPDGPKGVGMLVNLSLQPALAEARAQLLRAAMNRDSMAVEPRVIRASDLTLALEQKSDVCAEHVRETCLSELHQLCQSIARIEPKSDRPTVLTARTMLASGNALAAYQLLEQNCYTFEAKSDCMRIRFIAAQKMGDNRALDDSAAAFLAETCSTADTCAASALWIGSQLEASGHPGSAIRMYERAAEESGTQKAWSELSETATRLGFAAIAERAQRRAGAPHNRSNGVPHTL